MHRFYLMIASEPDLFLILQVVPGVLLPNILHTLCHCALFVHKPHSTAGTFLVFFVPVVVTPFFLLLLADFHTQWFVRLRISGVLASGGVTFCVNRRHVPSVNHVTSPLCPT